jgi:hypothetical protein
LNLDASNDVAVLEICVPEQSPCVIRDVAHTLGR